MRLFDVHAHMDMEPTLTKIEQVLKRSHDAGVKAIIANGTDPKSNRKVLDLSRKYDVIRPSLGLYPTETVLYSERELDDEISFIRSQKPVAIGEVGLDYKYADKKDETELKELSPEKQDEIKKLQQRAFIKFIALANELDIPIIVHSRKAEADTIELLKTHRAKKVVMHCFMGKKKFVKQIQEQGWMFSIPVVVTKLEQMQTIVASTPLSNLLTETDTPFLGPDQGVANEPANVSKSIGTIARLKGMTEEDVANQLFMNYLRMF